MEQKKTVINDLTQGSVMKQLILFTLPMMVGYALQVGFNLVDMFFMGRFAGTDALSAVSIGGQITMLMLSLFSGVAVGAQIYIAQTVGTGDMQFLNKMIGNTLTIGICAGAIVTLVIPFARPILILVRTPEEILDITTSYLMIYTAGSILTALYNAVCGILRGMGDSTRPTMFVAVASVVNIFLDYLFVARLHWGVIGAAWATVIGQGIACAAALIYLGWNQAELGFDLQVSALYPERRHVVILLRLGVPVAAKSLFICLSLVFVNAQINHMGVVAVAVTGICSKIQSLMNIVSQAMAESTASLVGQNIGSNKPERVKRTVYDAILVSLVFAVVLGAVFLLFPQQIFQIFSDDALVIAQARPFMILCTVVIFAGALMNPTQGLVNGAGDTLFNMVVALCDGVIARIALSLIFGYGLHLGVLGFFMGNCLAGFVSVIGGGWYFFSGRWQRRSCLAGMRECE